MKFFPISAFTIVAKSVLPFNAFLFTYIVRTSWIRRKQVDLLLCLFLLLRRWTEESKPRMTTLKAHINGDKDQTKNIWYGKLRKCTQTRPVLNPPLLLRLLGSFGGFHSRRFTGEALHRRKEELEGEAFLLGGGHGSSLRRCCCGWELPVSLTSVSSGLLIRRSHLSHRLRSRKKLRFTFWVGAADVIIQSWYRSRCVV